MGGRSVLRDDVGSGHCELVEKRCYATSFAFLEQFSSVSLLIAILLGVVTARTSEVRSSLGLREPWH